MSKNPLRFLCAVLILLGPLALLRAGEKTPRKPNVLFILADDLGYGDIGAHGCKDIPTPNIDRIAARGVRFTDGYANGSFCTPTRAALMSGKYQQRIGCEDLTRPLPQAVVTLPQRLRAAGYVTGMVGKWHLGAMAGFTPLDRGFDHFFGFLGGGHFYLPAPNQKGEYANPILRDREPLQEKRYLTDAFGDEAAAFVAAQKGSAKPFFLYLAFNAVHTPMQASDKHLAPFARIDNPQRRTYAGMLSAMDQAIGQVLKQLEEIGQLENTVIIFTSDNGGPTTRNAVNGSRNGLLRGSKCETFQGGIRVPLLLVWPGKLQPGTVYRRPVITMDLTATVLALAGADSKDIEGLDLVPYLDGKTDGSPHEVLYWRSRTMSNNYGARQGDWMFVHSTEGAEAPGPKQTPARDMLFNLADDISEKNDLAAAHPEKLAELRKLYGAWSAAVDADCRKLGIEPLFPKEAAAKQPALLDVLVVAPHPDDEALGCAGVMMQALEKKLRVGVVLVTNGDGFPKAAAVVTKKTEAQLEAEDFFQLAGVRQQHSVGALSRIGVRAGDLMALGYPDSGLKALYEATAETPYKQKFTGKTETYGAVLRDYHSLAHGRPAPYLRSSVLGDLEEIVRTRKPKDIYVTSEADTHADHKATFWFVRDAAKAAGYRGTLFTYVVHGQPPAGPAHRVPLTQAQRDRKRALIEAYQARLSPIHDDLAQRFTRDEEVFWPVPLE